MERYFSILIKIAVFFVLVVLLDQTIGFILRKLYYSQKAGQNYALTYSLKSCSADIIILGASQAQHNYDSRIISDSLHMSCYNAGQDGGHNILLQFAQIKVLTERYKPKIIMLEYSWNRLYYYKQDYEKLSILLPYYLNYPEIHSIINLRGPYEKIKLLSGIYPFNSNIINIIRFNTNSQAAKKKDFDGFVPIKDKVMNIRMLKSEPIIDEAFKIDTNMVSAFKKILRICKEKKIRLFVISSPVFHLRDDTICVSTRASKLAHDIIAEEEANYFDFSNYPLFVGKIEWFADRIHLNEKGAAMFTPLLISKLKNELKGQL